MSWLTDINDTLCCLKARVRVLETDAFDPTDPGPIGGATPDEGNFTNLNVSGETVYYTGAIFSYADRASAESHLLELGIETNNVVTDATTARTLVITDVHRYITFTNAGDITLTVPTNASVAFPIGTEIYFRRASSAGIISLSNPGVTVNGAATAATVAANGNFALKKKATDEWDLI